MYRTKPGSSDVKQRPLIPTEVQQRKSNAASVSLPRRSGNSNSSEALLPREPVASHKGCEEFRGGGRTGGGTAIQPDGWLPHRPQPQMHFSAPPPHCRGAELLS